MIAALPELPALLRARRARALVEDSRKVLSQVADAAVEEETRSRPYTAVADDLKISVAAVNKAVSRHRRTAQPK